MMILKAYLQSPKHFPFSWPHHHKFAEIQLQQQNSSSSWTFLLISMNKTALTHKIQCFQVTLIGVFVDTWMTPHTTSFDFDNYGLHLKIDPLVRRGKRQI